MTIEEALRRARELGVFVPKPLTPKEELMEIIEAVHCREGELMALRHQLERIIIRKVFR